MVSFFNHYSSFERDILNVPLMFLKKYDNFRPLQFQTHATNDHEISPEYRTTCGYDVAKKSLLCLYGVLKYFCFKAMHILRCRKHIIRIFVVPYQISRFT